MKKNHQKAKRKKMELRNTTMKRKKKKAKANRNTHTLKIAQRTLSTRPMICHRHQADELPLTLKATLQVSVTSENSSINLKKTVLNFYKRRSDKTSLKASQPSS